MPTANSKMPSPFFRYGYALLFATLPWSLGLRFGSVELDFPAEPLMAVLGVVLAAHFARNPGLLLRLLRSGPLLPLSAGWLGWMAWCAAWSSMPLISWKYWLVEAGHWWVFAVGIAVWPGLWPLLLRVFPLSMGGVAVYTMAHHAQYGFRADQALLSPMPFFEEHTVYAAAAVFALLGCGAQSLTSGKSSEAVTSSHRLTTILLATLLLAGLFLSHCRAAQVSAAAAVLVAALLLTGRRYRAAWLLAAAALCAGGIFFRGEILAKAQTAAARDVSALERLNRWACALRMAEERPITGFGPGTFQFQYLDFQQPDQMTRISATSPVNGHSPHTYGRGGGAHSEFMRALAEAGWPGLGLVVTLFVVGPLVIFARPEHSGRSRSLAPRSSVLSLLCALIITAFCVHGVVNDLLHDACVAAWVWGAMGVLQRRAD